MDIEHLTKSQIVLLTLLVSFVSSIATAIVTVSLVEQAPPEITQTINRVVERTVERVVPNEENDRTETVREITTVVSENEYVVSAVEKNQRHVVRLYAGTTSPTALRGLGVVVSREGVIAVDPASVAVPENYFAVSSDGTTYGVSPLYASATGTPQRIALMRLTTGEGGDIVIGAPQVSGSIPKLGQSVFAISGRDRSSVTLGIIRGLSYDASGAPAILETTVTSEEILFGTPLFSSDGALLGIHTTESYQNDRGGFVPFTASLLTR